MNLCRVEKDNNSTKIVDFQNIQITKKKYSLSYFISRKLCEVSIASFFSLGIGDYEIFIISFPFKLKVLYDDQQD